MMLHTVLCPDYTVEIAWTREEALTFMLCESVDEQAASLILDKAEKNPGTSLGFAGIRVQASIIVKRSAEDTARPSSG